MAKLKLYSATWCGQCSQVKDMLMQKGIAYELVDVDDNPEEINALVAQGIRGLPVVSVGEAMGVGMRGALEIVETYFE